MEKDAIHLYRPTGRLSKWIGALLVLFIIAVVILLVAYFNLAAYLSSVQDKTFRFQTEAFMAEQKLTRKANTLSAVSMIFLFASPPAMLVFAISQLIWVYRSHKNLLAFGREGLRFTPGWAVGWFLIPVANLVMPLLVMTEIWKGSIGSVLSGTPTHWKTKRVGMGVPAWWLLNLGIAGFSILSGLFLPSLQDPEAISLSTRGWLMAGIGAAGIAWAVVTQNLLNHISEVQEKNYRILKPQVQQQATPEPGHSSDPSPAG